MKYYNAVLYCEAINGKETMPCYNADQSLEHMLREINLFQQIKHCRVPPPWGS